MLHRSDDRVWFPSQGDREIKRFSFLLIAFNSVQNLLTRLSVDRSGLQSHNNVEGDAGVVVVGPDSTVLVYVG